MAKTPDFTKAYQDMLANMPFDTSAVSDSFRSQTALSEKMSKVALDAAERSTEISSQWARDTIARMGEVISAKDQPADYAKAMSDFASAAAEVAAEHMSAYAEVAKKVQMDTVDLMMNAGRDAAADAQKAAQKMGANVQDAAQKATKPTSTKS
ncbi:MAG: Phasin [Paracoccus denitrificans]|nr:MAG: Phasin [Paracoccus denitrificans]PZO84551.1 MAG: Phasin [Paracoccus denitrificans]